MADLNDLVPISSIPNLNAGLSSPSVRTMVAMLGAPREPLPDVGCRNDQASPAVKRLLKKLPMTDHFSLTGIKPAVESVQAVLAKVKEVHPELIEQLRTEDMICVRHKKPPDGPPSNEASNHSWGTAVDFKMKGHEAPQKTRPNVPRWVAMLVPFFNQAGWFAGISFNDAMHFEVASETIRKWKSDGLLGTVEPEDAAVAGNGGGGGGNVFSSIGGFFSGLFGGRA